jgi:hypothetical protein
VLSLRDLQLSFCRSVTGPPSTDLLVLTRLSETLREAFPVVRKIVGPDCFDYAAHTFIEEHLPTEACLSAYGTQFHDFLRSFSAVSQLTYLPDVARLEWSISQVVRAAPEDWMPITQLGDLSADPAAARLRLTPCVQYLASGFRIDQIWMAHQAEDDDSSSWHIDIGEAYLEINACASLRLNIIPKAAWVFRARLADGHTLGSATAMALDVDPDFDIPGALGSLFGEHLVAAIGDGLD